MLMMIVQAAADCVKCTGPLLHGADSTLQGWCQRNAA